MNESRKATILFLAVAALYGCTRSLWLDEWDSVQFAMGLKEFNLWQGQPHPPGYPLYIFAGKLLAALGLAPTSALVALGCFAGAAFVSTWYLIVRAEFDETFAWVVAAATAFTPAIWMTSTKALTDMPAAMAVSIQIFHAVIYRRDRKDRDLWTSAIWGAVATGIRPQWFGIAALLLATTLWVARPGARRAIRSVVLFLVANLLWFSLMCVVQARAEPKRQDVWAYPHQLVKQWKWRLDKPKVYLGAGEMTWTRIRHRGHEHLQGWIRRGLGLATVEMRRAVVPFLWAGVALTAWRARNKKFWQLQAPWSIALVALVFCCLPEDRRYYTALAPLFWIAVLAGAWRLPRAWRWSVAAAPALMLALGLPLAAEGHRVPPAPVQMAEFLERRHPPEERGAIWLMMSDARRHAEWYAPEFKVSLARPYAIDARSFRNATAIYTDAPGFECAGLFAGFSLEPVTNFSRNPVIYPKHHRVELFRLAPPGQSMR